MPYKNIYNIYILSKQKFIYFGNTNYRLNISFTFQLDTFIAILLTQQVMLHKCTAKWTIMSKNVNGNILSNLESIIALNLPTFFRSLMEIYFSHNCWKKQANSTKRVQISRGKNFQMSIGRRQWTNTWLLSPINLPSLTFTHF